MKVKWLLPVAGVMLLAFLLNGCGGEGPSCDTDKDCPGVQSDEQCVAYVCKDHRCVLEIIENMLCDDHNECTVGDLCGSDGVCRGTPRVCEEPKDPCKVAVCEPDKGCVEVPGHDGAQCDDNDVCTVEDRCEQGVCKGRPKCEDKEGDCYEVTCNPKTGECEQKELSAGTTCDDNNPCTKDDKCREGGVCEGTWDEEKCQCTSDDECREKGFDLCLGPVRCEDNKCVQDTSHPVECGEPKGECWTRECNGDTGECEDKPKDSGSACDDGDKCTTEDQCNGHGECVGKPIDCDDNNECTADRCDEATGECVHEPQAGHKCDDGNVCTKEDVCNAKGECVGTEPIFDCCNEDADCDDSYGCTLEHCDKESNRCVYEVKGCEAAGGCEVSMCVSGGCKRQSDWRIKVLGEWDFEGEGKAGIKGVRVEGDYEFSGGIKAKGDVNVHLPVLPGSGERLVVVKGEGEVSVKGYEEGGDGAWEGSGDVVVQVPSNGLLRYVGVYELGGSCEDAAVDLGVRPKDTWKVIGGVEGFLVLWLEQQGDDLLLKARFYRYNGEAAGEEVVLESNNFANLINISGYYDEASRRWVVWYGPVGVSSNPGYFTYREVSFAWGKGKVEEVKDVIEGSPFNSEVAKITKGVLVGSSFARSEGGSAAGCVIFKGKPGAQDLYGIMCRLKGQWVKVSATPYGNERYTNLKVLPASNGYFVTWVREVGDSSLPQDKTYSLYAGQIKMEGNGAISGKLFSQDTPLDYRSYSTGTGLSIVLKDAGRLKDLLYRLEGGSFKKTKEQEFFKDYDVRDFEEFEQGGALYLGVLASSHDNGGVEVLLKDLGTNNTWTFAQAGSADFLGLADFVGGYLGLVTLRATETLTFTLNGIGCKEGWRGSEEKICKGLGY